MVLNNKFIFQILINLFSKKIKTMKVAKIFIFAIVLFFFSCKNENKTNESTTEPKLTKEQKDAIAESTMDFWTKNNCTLEIPKAIVNESQKGEGYSFELDKIRGRSIEKLTFDKGDELTVINKGCSFVWVAYSFALNEKVHELDLTDKIAVSKKMLSLIDFASKLTTPPLEMKGRLPMLGQVIEQIGPFEMGQEFLFSSETIKEGFTLDKIEKRNGKLLLDFYFSRGPV